MELSIFGRTNRKESEDREQQNKNSADAQAIIRQYANPIVAIQQQQFQSYQSSYQSDSDSSEHDIQQTIIEINYDTNHNQNHNQNHHQSHATNNKNHNANVDNNNNNNGNNNNNDNDSHNNINIKNGNNINQNTQSKQLCGNLKVQIYKSAKYLIEIFKMQLPNLLISFIVIGGVVVLQMKLKTDSDCDLRELFENQDTNNIESKCPTGQYILIMLKNILFTMIVNFVMFLMTINMYQFKKRRLIQYIFTTLMLVHIGRECLFQNLNRLKMVNEFTMLLAASNILFIMMTRHNFWIMVQRLTQMLLYIMVVFYAGKLNAEVRDNRSFFLVLLLQYFTLIYKKISYFYLKQRLKHNLQYDDVSMCYIVAIIYEYSFIFDQILVQNESSFRKVATAINFLMIQSDNINNMNIFKCIYQFFLRNRKFLSLQNSISLQYALLIGAVLIGLAYLMLIDLFIFSIIGIVIKLFSKFVCVDNYVAEQNQQVAMIANGYLDQKIQDNEINDFIAQQSIIAYFHFLVYQILLIIVKVVFEQNDNISKEYQVIYQIQETSSNSLGVTQIIVFNCMIIVAIFYMVILKGQQEFRVVKQATKHQIFIIQLITSMCIICGINKRLFETQYMKQPNKL